MFERIKRALGIGNGAAREDEPESIDHPRPRRVNANPPQRDWFARVRTRSEDARAAADAELARNADDLLARTVGRSRP